MSGTITVAVVSVSIIVLLVCMFAYGCFRLSADARQSALEQAEILVDAHFAALNRLLDDPATPDSLAGAAVMASERCADPKVAERVLLAVHRKLSAGDTIASSGHTATLMRDLARLEAHRPDLANSFRDAIHYAIAGGAARYLAGLLSPLSIFREIRIQQRLRAERGRGVGSRDFAVGGLDELCRA